MKSIFINRNPVDGPWGGGNKFVMSMYALLPRLGFKIIENPYVENPDYIFLQSPKSSSDCNFSINDAIKLKSKFPSTKVVLRVNDNDARKNTEGVDDLWISSSQFVDTTIFVSNWIKDYFLEKGWKCNNNHVLYNGVDLKFFKPNKKIKNGKINIVTHHWSIHPAGGVT